MTESMSHLGAVASRSSTSIEASRKAPDSYFVEPPKQYRYRPLRVQRVTEHLGSFRAGKGLHVFVDRL